MTSTVCPPATPPRSSIPSAVPYAIGSAASSASSSGDPSTRWARSTGTTTKSANPPSRSLPRMSTGFASGPGPS